MEREERIKELARRITNALLECDDFTYEDMARSIAYLVGVLDRLSEKANNTKSGTFAKYVFDMIGSVYKVSSDKQEWRPSTEHPLIDEYGDAYSLDDLKEDFEKHKDGFDNDSYDAYLRSKGKRLSVKGRIDFISDGLRWSHYDFS